MEDTTLNKKDWINAKKENLNLIIGNKMQIEMAKVVIKHCEKKIKEFPDDEEDSASPPL